MISHQLNIVKLVDLIEKESATRNYLKYWDSLIALNSLVKAHAIVTGTNPEYYGQTEPEKGPAKDYHVV